MKLILFLPLLILYFVEILEFRIVVLLIPVIIPLDFIIELFKIFNLTFLEKILTSLFTSLIADEKFVWFRENENGTLKTSPVKSNILNNFNLSKNKIALDILTIANVLSELFLKKILLFVTLIFLSDNFSILILSNKLKSFSYKLKLASFINTFFIYIHTFFSY